MLPLHWAPELLVCFMVALAVLPLAIVWLDDRRGEGTAERLARLRESVRLREHLARRAAAEHAPLPEVVVPRV